MKPRNFKGRKLLRQARAKGRIAMEGGLTVNPRRQHEFFVLHCAVPQVFNPTPKDIRIRLGAEARSRT